MFVINFILPKLLKNKNQKKILKKNCFNFSFRSLFSSWWRKNCPKREIFFFFLMKKKWFLKTPVKKLNRFFFFKGEKFWSQNSPLFKKFFWVLGFFPNFKFNGLKAYLYLSQVFSFIYKKGGKTKKTFIP